MTVEMLGRAYALSALVMGHTVLLGAIILEGLDLAVDPVRQRLMPNLGGPGSNRCFGADSRASGRGGDIIMPGTKALRFWLILGIALLWVSLISQLCHEILLARGRGPVDALHQLQRTYPLHVGLLMAVTGLVALCATRLAYCARRAPRRDG